MMAKNDRGSAERERQIAYLIAEGMIEPTPDGYRLTAKGEALIEGVTKFVEKLQSIASAVVESATPAFQKLAEALAEFEQSERDIEERRDD